MSSDENNETVPHWLQEHCERLAANDPTLTNLCLNVRRLDEASSKRLASSLQTNATLQTLNLTSSFANAATTADAFKTFALEGLLRQTHLQVLHLSYNRLDEHVATLEPVLACCSSGLVTLHLDHNEIQSNAIAALARGLSCNTRLNALHLRSNRIDDSGCLALAQALQSNQTLQTLDLSSNPLMTATGASALLHALEDCNYSLTTLLLEQNDRVPRALVANIRVVCRANLRGRRQLLRDELPPRLWPRLLCHENVDTVCYLLKIKPEMANYHHDNL
ncbi:hypothetical protein MPSEU_000051500 [Mayamaea pseudoterrestris]|nr:hypothetical protein MPSEU_000051500 [Mayamaea pseudoterrestris]